MKNIKKFSLLMGMCILLIGSVSAKEKIKKHRDQLRFGYDKVTSKEVYEMGNDGELYHVRTDVWCSNGGSMRCRASSIANPDPTNELDVFDPAYTPAEKAVAENVLVDGDTQIEGGSASGTVSQTVQFINTTTGQSYYRTFSYVWITNSDGTIDSSLDVSDPF